MSYKPLPRPSPDAIAVCAARRDLGWTQRELARRSGVAHTTISKLETGRSQTMHIRTRARLRAAFLEAIQRSENRR